MHDLVVAVVPQPPPIHSRLASLPECPLVVDVDDVGRRRFVADAVGKMSWKAKHVPNCPLPRLACQAFRPTRDRLPLSQEEENGVVALVEFP